jgi:hypothetical protein
MRSGSAARVEDQRGRIVCLPLGLVAQLVEQRIENPCVGGSIPPRATKNIVQETPTHAGWRFRFWGS